MILCERELVFFFFLCRSDADRELRRKAVDDGVRTIAPMQLPPGNHQPKPDQQTQARIGR